MLGPIAPRVYVGPRVLRATQLGLIASRRGLAKSCVTLRQYNFFELRPAQNAFHTSTGQKVKFKKRTRAKRDLPNYFHRVLSKISGTLGLSGGDLTCAKLCLIFDGNKMVFVFRVVVFERRKRSLIRKWCISCRGLTQCSDKYFVAWTSKRCKDIRICRFQLHCINLPGYVFKTARP